MRHKLTINRLAWNTIRHRKKQYTVLIISIVLAMIFSSGVPFFLSCMNASLEQMQLRRLGRQDLFLLDAQELPLEELQQNKSITGEFGYMHTLSYIWYGEKEERGTELAWMDERAEELYFPQLKKGRLPEKSGEIAMEEDALLRMGLETELNKTLTFHARAHDGSSYIAQATEKSYTLVGILENRRPRYEVYHTSGKKIPAAFVCRGEQTEIGGKEGLIALAIQNATDPAAVGDFYALAQDHHFSSIREGNYGNSGIELMKNGRMISFLSLLLAFLTCFSIMNAFSTLLKERTAQIGMMRAVGATRRQIFWIFGRETLLLALICAPVSLGISLGCIALYAYYMGDDFVFAPNFSVLGVGILFGLFCVMAAALIPLFAISRLSPMQAIRNVHLSRKMQRGRIHSRKTFKMPQLLAKRKTTFSKGRTILIRMILAGTVLACCTSAIMFCTSLKFKAASSMTSDFEIHPTNWQNPKNHFVYSDMKDFMTEAQRQETLEIPLVESVYGTKKISVNLLMDEVPKYLRLFEIQDYQMSRYEYCDLFSPDVLPMTEEKLLQITQEKELPIYAETKARAGYEQEVLSIAVRSADSAHFKELFQYQITEGKVDLDALNRGEEIILMAPEKVGFIHQVNPNGGGTYGAIDISPENLKKMSSAEKANFIASAENPFHAGDELTLSMLFEQADGSLRRVDRTVRIGAIVRARYSDSSFSLLTTNEAMELFGQDFPYDHLYVDCTEEFSGEADMEMQTAFAAAFPSKEILSTYEMNRSGQDTLRYMAVSFISLIAVLLVVCTSLINNGITAQIREDRRSIGTLRAVGASQRDITHCYRLQIINTLLWGVGIGLFFVVAGMSVFAYIFYIAELPFWVGILPAFALLAVLLCICLVNLHVQVKKISRQSIVENIREL